MRRSKRKDISYSFLHHHSPSPGYKATQFNTIRYKPEYARHILTILSFDRKTFENNRFKGKIRTADAGKPGRMLRRGSDGKG